MNSPSTAISPFAHLFGQPKPAPSTVKAEKPKSSVQILASTKAKAAAKPTAKALKTVPAKPASKPKRATGHSYSHLQPAEYVAEADDATAPAKAVQNPGARAILAAADKARTPTGTGAPPPTGLAAKIIAAGKKRRGEI